MTPAHGGLDHVAQVMFHLTLNTDKRRWSPRSEVRDDVLPIVTPWLEPGEHKLSFGPSARLVVPVSVAGWIGTIYLDQAPVVTIGIADDDQGADTVWPALESLYLQITDRPPIATIGWEAPVRPISTPWVASVIVGPMPDTIAGMIVDLERCLAWAFVEKRR